MEFQINDQVVDESNNKGWVRYIGPVAISKKADMIWIGVEWETQGRGKYDGSVEVNGETVRYFTCPPTQGSFVKPQTLKKPISFMDAMRTRYEAPANAGEEEHKHLPSGIRRSAGSVMQIEPVGMEKIRQRQQVHLLREVSLVGMGLSSAGEDDEIAQNCQGIKVLDLGDNVIDSWVTVGKIISQLPELEYLTLGNNSLKTGLPINPINPLPPMLKHANLQVLILNRTNTTLSQIQRLEEERAFPMLSELVLCDNNLETLDPLANLKAEEVKHQKGSYAAWAQNQIKLVDRSGFTPESFAKGFHNLKKIDISKNKISNWSEVWRLSRLPNLREINAADNPIDIVFFDEPLQTVAERPVSKMEEKDLMEEASAIAKKSNPPSWFAGKKTKTKEELELIEQERQRLAEEFAKSLSTGEAYRGESQLDQSKEDLPEIDIVMSNGIAVPTLEKRERAKYTEARLFKGTGTEGGTYPFKCLETLSLSRCRVSTWVSIDALDRFPALVDLRLKECPVIVMAASSTAGRQTTIARMSKLKRLNGSEIPERERSDAERLYLKRVAVARASLNDADAIKKLLEENPRYDDLVGIHGDPMAVAERSKEMNSGTLSATSAKVKISSFDPRSCTIPPVTKRLPAQMTVSELKQLCNKLFGVDVELQKLFYREVNKQFGHPVHLDVDELTINDYGVGNDGEIIMEARDLEKEAADAAKRAQKEKQMMEKQEEVARREAILKQDEIEQSKQGLSQSR